MGITQPFLSAQVAQLVEAYLECTLIYYPKTHPVTRYSACLVVIKSCATNLWEILVQIRSGAQSV